MTDGPCRVLDRQGLARVTASVISYGATMTVTFFDWQRATFPPGVAPYNTLSPNLIAVRHELETRHGGTRLGGYGVRPVRNGTDPSSHGFGAAINHRIEPRERLLQAVDWLIANHVRLGIQAIHDYVGCRIWHANRYPGKPMEAWWRPQRPNPANGMGQSWATYLHIETDRLNWGNNVPVHLRDLVNPLPPPVEPKPTVLFDPAKGVWGLYPLNKNKLTIREVTHTAATDEAEALCLYLQWVLRLKASQNIKPDGDFGPSTGDAVERFQTYLGLHVDRVVGPQTWAWIDRLASR